MTTKLPPAGTVDPASIARWRDRKRYLWLLGLVAPSLTGSALLGFSLTGNALWLWAAARQSGPEAPSSWLRAHEGCRSPLSCRGYVRASVGQGRQRSPTRQHGPAG